MGVMGFGGVRWVKGRGKHLEKEKMREVGWDLSLIHI